MYLSWNNKTITDFSDKNITSLYCEGYLFTREGKGQMYQTRSLRIDLNKFEPSSENKRVLRKNEAVELTISPLPYANYHWSIGKLGKDFYETKFGLKTFSANKIKELLTDENKSNFNKLFIYTVIARSESDEAIPSPAVGSPRRSLALTPRDDNSAGYCISLETNELLHYCYPFYDLESNTPNLGLGMMTKAVIWAKEHGKKYIYLGSAQRPTDTYKLQFDGLEWFDGKKWQTNLEELKKVIKNHGVSNTVVDSG